MKWADLCITAVRYNAQHQHIDRVRARPDVGESLGTEQEYARNDIVNAIDQKMKVITVYKKLDGFHPGADVGIDVVHGVKYLKTVPDLYKADNLGALPEF